MQGVVTPSKLCFTFKHISDYEEFKWWFQEDFLGFDFERCRSSSDCSSYSTGSKLVRKCDALMLSVEC